MWLKLALSIGSHFLKYLCHKILKIKTISCFVGDTETTKHKIDYSRTEDNSPIIPGSETGTVLESLEGLFLELTMWSAERWAKPIFGGQNCASKP